MREILFRGKRVDNGEWVYGDLLNVGVDYDYAIRTYGGREHGQVNAVSEETVGQYTGLRDRTRTEEHPEGRKIFEGDIVKGKDSLAKEIELYGYIDHKNGSFVIVGDLMTHYRWLDYDVEIIGNIHDNPELLKGGTER